MKKTLVVSSLAAGAILALLGSLCLGSVALSPAQVFGALGAKIFGASGAVSAGGASLGAGASGAASAGAGSLGAASAGAAFGVDEVTIVIVWQLRLARTLLAGVAGAALGASGAVLQGLFRNPLADPYSLGVSSGASLGAVAAIALGAKLGLDFPGATEAAAFVGAIASSAIVYAVATANRRTAPTAALLLAGAAVGSFLSAIVSLIVALNDKDLHTVFFWMLGGSAGRAGPISRRPSPSPSSLSSHHSSWPALWTFSEPVRNRREYSDSMSAFCGLSRWRRHRLARPRQSRRAD